MKQTRPHTLLGVPGTLTTIPGKTLWHLQEWESDRRELTAEQRREIGFPAHLKAYGQATICFDSLEEKNTSSYFSLTGNFAASSKHWTGGCCHDLIAMVFPELAHLEKWHLLHPEEQATSVANTLYLAGNRDCYGRLAGEPCDWDWHVKFGGFPITVKVGEKFKEWLEQAVEDGTKLVVKAVPYIERGSGPKYDFSPYYSFEGHDVEWHRCPFKTLHEAEAFALAFNAGPVSFIAVPTRFSAGKERELDKARQSARWPEATDEALSLPKDELRALLEARVPLLRAEFYAALAEMGLKRDDQMGEP